VHAKLDYCNSLYYSLPNTQLNCLQHIQNSLAHAIIRAPKSSHINPALKSLHWLKIKQHIDYIILTLTSKVLTTTQPSYLYNLISVQLHHSTRSSDIITLSRPPSCSSLEGHQPLFPSCVTLPVESASQGTSPAFRSQRLITLIWCHTCQFVISCITTITIHYSFSLPLQTLNSSFPQIFSSIVLLPFHFSPTGLTSRTRGVFRFSRACRF